MSSEWPFITFSEAPFLIIDGDRGTNYPKQHEFVSSGHCLFLNAGNVTKEGFAFSECAFISEEKDLLLRKGKLQRHDIVLTTRGTVGNAAYYSDNIEFDHIRINSGMVIFRPDPTQILPYYLYLFLRSNNFNEQVKSLTSGSAQPQLPIRDMNRIVIPIPPIEVQAEICFVLGGLDDRIALLRETNATLEAIAQSLFKSWFVDFDPVLYNSSANAGTQAPSLPAEIQALFPSRLVESPQGLIPEGWEVGTMQDLFVLQRGFDLPASERTEGEYPLIAASGPNGTHNKAKVKGPGVVTGRSGVLGKVFFTLEDFWPLNTTLWIKEFKRATPCYALEVLKRLDTLSFNAGSAVPSLNRNHIHGLPYLLPPIELIESFEATAMTLRRKMHENCKHAESLISLRDTLLPRLISGQLRLPEAEAALVEGI